MARTPEWEWTAIYGLYDDLGDLLYVGITSDPHYRWSTHRRQKPWWNEVAHRSVWWCDTRAEAEAAENAIINEANPKYNVTRSVPYEDWSYPIEGSRYEMADL